MYVRAFPTGLQLVFLKGQTYFIYMKRNVLPMEFYQAETEKVARELLGKRLVHSKGGKLTSGTIIETEAYLGKTDPACHTFNGRRTERVESMYLAGGHAYVYFVYGIHFCFNVVTRPAEIPEAVLIRALWPVDGKEVMKKRRKTQIEKQLCSGPGKLCQALGIDRESNGLLLTGKKLWIEDDYSFKKIKKYIQKSARIGVDYAGSAKKWPLRFFIDEKILKEC